MATAYTSASGAVSHCRRNPNIVTSDRIDSKNITLSCVAVVSDNFLINILPSRKPPAPPGTPTAPTHEHDEELQQRSQTTEQTSGQSNLAKAASYQWRNQDSRLIRSKKSPSQAGSRSVQKLGRQTDTLRHGNIVRISGIRCGLIINCLGGSVVYTTFLVTISACLALLLVYSQWLWSDKSSIDAAYLFINLLLLFIIMYLYTYDSIIRLHRMHVMQTIVTDDRGVCLSVCQSARQSVTQLMASLCKNGWTDQDAAWGKLLLETLRTPY